MLKKVCVVCGGRGKMTCDKCNGTGRKIGNEIGFFGGRTERMSTSTCYSCKGRGEIPCSNCGGTGKQN